MSEPTVELFDVYEEDRKTRRQAKAVRRKQHKIHKQRVRASRRTEIEPMPSPTWGSGGQNRPQSLRGAVRLKVRGIPTTTHTAATAYPYVAGPSLGPGGIYLGYDLNGGGAFCFDPWDLYKRGIISGMAMLLFGQVGTGKSSLAKSFACRQVKAGRKLSVASDKKGEWTPVVHALGGEVIQVGPGLSTRLNPLDPGTRPSVNPRGEPMREDEWEMIVRTRRMATLETLVKILINRDLSPAEHSVVAKGLHDGVRARAQYEQAVVIPDVINQLWDQKHKAQDQLIIDAAMEMAMTLQRVTSGDLAGMFDGETSVNFDADAPAVSVDTSALRGASPDAIRVVNACAGAWTEAMVTTSDGGQRVVVYEEGWDNISSEADLQRMMESWKMARAYGIFNILVLHKIADLDMAGDKGSRMTAMAKSLLADADVKVIYRQDQSALKITLEELDLSSRERSIVKSLDDGVGLWRLGQSSFQIKNELTNAEKPLFDTDERMGIKSDEEGA